MMPIYQAPPFELDFSRGAIILDTSVLFAAFFPADQRHENARAFLDLTPDEVIIPISVVIETWGMLVGKNKRWDKGWELLAWLGNPGKVTLILQNVDRFDTIRDIMQTMRVDCVDASLMRLGHEMSNQCDLKPAIRIATYDTSDFVKCIISFRLRIILHNPDTFEDEQYNVH